MSSAVPAVVLAGALLAWMTVENVRTNKLRDPFTLGGAAAVTALLAVSCAVAGELGPLVGGVAGGAALFGLGFACAVANPVSIGFGTVKACLVLGLAAGSLGRAPEVVAVLALPVATVVSWMVWRRRPFLPSGPALGAAYLAAVVT